MSLELDFNIPGKGGKSIARRPRKMSGEHIVEECPAVGV